MKSEKASKHVCDLFHRSGWKTGRRVDTQAIKALLLSQGFSPTEATLNFIQEFDNLIVVSPQGPLVLNVSRALSGLDYELRPWIERLVGEMPCPVGHGLFVFLFVLSSGQILMLEETWLTFAISSNVFDAIEALVFPGEETARFIELSFDQIPEIYRDP